MEVNDIEVKIIVNGYSLKIFLANENKTTVTTTIGKIVKIASTHLKVVAALPSKTRCVKSFAKILSDPPACSNAKKKKMLATINTPTTNNLSFTTFAGSSSSSLALSSSAFN